MLYSRLPMSWQHASFTFLSVSHIWVWFERSDKCRYVWQGWKHWVANLMSHPNDRVGNRVGFEPASFCSQGEHVNRYATGVTVFWEWDCIETDHKPIYHLRLRSLNHSELQVTNWQQAEFFWAGLSEVAGSQVAWSLLSTVRCEMLHGSCKSMWNYCI